MSLPKLFMALGSSLTDLQVSELLQTNERSTQYGIVLTEEDAREIIEARDDVLHSYGRVELDSTISRKLIQAFCTSPHMDQEDYVSTLIDLHEVFYYLKK